MWNDGLCLLAAMGRDGSSRHLRLCWSFHVRAKRELEESQVNAVPWARGLFFSWLCRAYGVPIAVAEAYGPYLMQKIGCCYDHEIDGVSQATRQIADLQTLR